MDVFFDWRWIIRKNNIIWVKVSADIKKEFKSEPVHNKKFLKTKIRSHDDEIADFYDTKIPKLELVWQLKKDKSFCPQYFFLKIENILKKRCWVY